MIYLKIGRKRLWIELLSRLLAFREWDFHFEHRSTLFDTHAFWVGPLHVIVCDTRPSTQPAPRTNLRVSASRIEEARNA
jgi:hypothetical protein